MLLYLSIIKRHKCLLESVVIIDGFNKLHRKISTGVEKIVDELMSSIRFCNTPEGDIPHYLFIFRKPYILGKELNNRACSRLVTMLYL